MERQCQIKEPKPGQHTHLSSQTLRAKNSAVRVFLLLWMSWGYSATIKGLLLTYCPAYSPKFFSLKMSWLGYTAKNSAKTLKADSCCDEIVDEYMGSLQLLWEWRTTIWWFDFEGVSSSQENKYSSYINQKCLVFGESAVADPHNQEIWVIGYLENITCRVCSLGQWSRDLRLTFATVAEWPRFSQVWNGANNVCPYTMSFCLQL